MVKGRYGWRIAGFIFKALCGLIIAFVIGILAWRIIDRSITPKQVKTIIPNHKLCEAYEKYGDKLTLYYQENTNEYTQENHNYGYFANGGTLFIDEADQVQFILRYNKSTLEHVAEDFKLSEVPSREENIFDVSLVIMYDLTPENEKDNDGKTPEAVEYVRIAPSGEALSYQKTLYNYHKYVFDGVEVDESVLAIYIDIYYIGELDYNERSLGTLLIYDYTYPNKEYNLTKNDIKAIESFDTSLVKCENGSYTITLPESNIVLKVPEYYESYIPLIKDKLIVEAEQKIAAAVADYPGNSGYHLTSDYEGHLCLCIEVIRDIDPPNVVVVDDETILSGCDIDHEHIFFAEIITE